MSKQIHLLKLAEQDCIGNCADAVEIAKMPDVPGARVRKRYMRKLLSLDLKRKT